MINLIKTQAVSFYPRGEQIKLLEWKALKNRLKTSTTEPPKLELKELPENLEYAFLQGEDQLPVVISSALSTYEKTKLLEVLKSNKGDINQSISDIKGIDSYFQIPIAREDQEKTTFTCPYGTFAYKRMSFGLSNAPATFQRCMMAIFHELIKENMEVFMDDFYIFRSSFDHFLEFDIEIHDKKGAENLAADHLSRIENLDLGKLTKAKIRDLVLEEQLMIIFDKSKEPCNARTKSYGDVSPKTRLSKFFDNIIVVRYEDIMGSPLRKEWSHKLDDALWAFRTVFKTPLGTTPFRIIYGKACYFPIKLEHKAYWTLMACNMDLTIAGANIFLQINEQDELRLDAYESSISYKERTKKWHDKRIKTPINYEKVDKVLLFNSRLRLFPGKLKSRWYGPFTISRVMRSGAIELSDE
ncbi:reverse transcriptase domain-containing protein [Tanacetum coccineum]